MNLYEKRVFLVYVPFFYPSIVIYCFPKQNFSDELVAGICKDGEFNNVIGI